MRVLEERILKDGKIFPGNILKVGSFLNHQVDVRLLAQMGKEASEIFGSESVTKILTVEASGIAIATAFAVEMRVPVLFAKKNNSANLSDDVYSARTHSYTHGNDYSMVVEKEFLTPDDRVLIVDDFLANGAALNGLISLVEQSGATLVGCAIAIEKAFQPGGREIRERGIKVHSFARIKSMTDDTIEFCD